MDCKMKISLKSSFIALAVSMAVFGFVSCDNDNETPIVPARSANDAHGTYTGVVYAGKIFQDTVKVTVDSVSKTVQMPRFPVKAIVEALVDSSLQAEALKSATECSIRMAYTGTVSSDIASLKLGAQVADFDMTVNNEKKSVKVFFGAKGECLYNNTFRILNVALTVDSIQVNGETEKSVKPIQYTFLQTKKK